MYTCDLTIVIPAKNEEKNLPVCLASIGSNFAKKIILIDSESTDRTKEIAASFGITVVDFQWNGKFPKKRNWFLQTHDIETKWVLFLDADEYITEDFKQEVKKSLQSKDKVGFWLSYHVYFLGKQLKGGYPLRKLALFKTGSGEYEEIEENHWSDLDMEVHEHLLLKGKTGIIKSKIDHQDFRGVTHFVLKHNEYASWEAARFLKQYDQKKHLNSWTWNQRLKYYLMGSILFPPIFFLGTYILYCGFIDGSRGFTHALLRMAYYNQVYCKIQELKLQNKSLLKTANIRYQKERKPFSKTNLAN